MTTADARDALKKTLQTFGVDEKPGVCEVRVEKETVESHNELRERLASPGAGWVCCTDAVFVIGPNAAADPPVTTAGSVGDIDFSGQRRLLYGELIVDERNAIRFRESENGWDLFTIRESDGTTHLSFDERYLSRTSGPLHYRVYYRRETVLGIEEWRPWVARLLDVEARRRATGGLDA
jgi:hypothetical protein